MTSSNFNNQNGPFGNVIDGFVYPQFIGYATRAPTTQDIYNPGTKWQDNSVNPPVIYETTGAGIWSTSGVNQATTTTYGTVILTDDSQPVATKAYADALVIAGAPVATETVAGIGQLATDAEAIAGTPSTGLLALLVTPSNLAPVLASPSAIGSTTPAAGTFTALTTDGTGLVTLASSGDVNISTATGSFVVSAGENATDAVVIESTAGGVQILASGAAAGEDIVLTATGSSIRLTSSESATDSINIESTAGGINILASGAAAGEDINITATGSSVNITATENVANSIVISSSNGGIDITAASAAAGEDIDITATGSSVNITATENDAGAIYVRANGGTSERIRLHSDQGTGVDSIIAESDVGGITLLSGLASADAINITSTNGGVDINGALQVNIASSQNAIDAIRIVASAGGIDIDSGTGGFIVDTTGAISLDAAAASNFTVTGAFDISMITTAGSANITAGEDAADAIVLSAGAGGIDILATGAAGQDIDIVNTGGSVNITATEDAAESIYIRANGGTSETLRLHADQGTGVASINIGSDVGGVTISGGLGTADAINISASTAGGGIDIDASTGGVIVDTTGSISLDSATASNFTVTGAADLTLASSAGSVNITAGESAIDSIVINSTAGGIDILASGAAAGEDIDIIATGSSINITATENVTDAIVIDASGAASRVRINAGTGSIHIDSGQIVAVTSITNADSPYSVLGTDYFISVDTSGGAVTVTLPAATVLAGRTFVIRDSGGAAAVNNITISGGGTNLVGGGASAATKTISAAYAGATVYSNGTTWNYCYVA